jgi:hypothetical protein
MAKPPAGKKPAPPKKPVAKKAAPKPAAPKKAAGKAAPARKAPAAKKPAVPQYDREKAAAAVLEELAAGASLIAVCKREGFPSFSTFMRWLAEEGAAGDSLRDQYARAREAQAEVMAEEILAIADEECTMVKADKHGSMDDDGEGNTEVVFDSTAVQRNKLRVDTRKWLLSKMAPKKYGDKLVNEHTGANGGAIQVASTVTFVRPPARSEDEA